jgi:Protein of unknown function (DUF1059)
MPSDQTLTATCPRCGLNLQAADEDELVAAVQQHVRDDHGFERELPRKHVLAYLRGGGASGGPVHTEG